jgi:hypothetical protein
VAKREGWRERRDGQIRGMEGGYERGGDIGGGTNMKGMARWKA